MGIIVVMYEFTLMMEMYGIKQETTLKEWRQVILFGYAVSISSNGWVLAIGAPNIFNGFVRVYSFNDGIQWQKVEDIKGKNLEPLSLFRQME